ncbi:MAG: DUF192 domain-containing protein [Candidatus Micrarchaeales archaeon]
MAKKNKNTVAVLFLIAIAVILLLYFKSQQQIPQLSSLDQSFNVIKLNVSIGNSSSVYYAYIASTLQQQEQGYMNQTSIGDCGSRSPCLGMLFLFNNQSYLCFWMHNTEIPLNQLWIAANGTVTYEYVGQPYSNNTICYNAIEVLETLPNQRIPLGSKIRIQ